MYILVFTPSNWVTFDNLPPPSFSDSVLSYFRRISTVCTAAALDFSLPTSSPEFHCIHMLYRKLVKKLTRQPRSKNKISVKNKVEKNQFSFLFSINLAFMIKCIIFTIEISNYPIRAGICNQYSQPCQGIWEKKGKLNKLKNSSRQPNAIKWEHWINLFP